MLQILKKIKHPMNIKHTLLFIILIMQAMNISAGDFELYDCFGKETGKIEGFISERQLLLECFDFSNKCSAKFFINSFDVTLDEQGMYTALGPNYFEFDPKTGKVQGVSQEHFHYFVGTCKKH